MKIKNVIMSVDDSHHQYFWPVVANVCRKVLKIQPVLFRVSDEDGDFYNDGNGLVKKVKRIEGIPTSTQGQLLRLYGTKYFPEEVCLISDVDMMLLSKKYFVEDLSEFSDDSYVIFSSDGYDLSRKECRDLFDFQVYPMCYHAAKGKIFSDILEIEGGFEDFVNRVISSPITNKVEWYSDEVYLSHMLNSKFDNYQIHKLKRGFEDNYYIPTRIEKYNFPVDYRGNEEMRITNSRIGNYDLGKLKENYYIDCHCVRPYGWYKQEIWDVADIAIENNNEPEKDLILITAYCDTHEKVEILRNLVKQISSHKKKFDLMLISHTTIPQDIALNTDFTIYDKKNELLYDPEMRCKPWFTPNEDRPILSIYTGFYNSHLAIWRMIILGNSIAKNCGYEKVHHIEYDCNIESFDELYKNSKLLEYHDSITYIKSEENVEDILFGTYQAYKLNSLPEDLLVLDEKNIKQKIKNSDTKSPEGMLGELLHKSNNFLIKSKKDLDEGGNFFGLSHVFNKKHTAWCLPYFDERSGNLCFIIWNMEGNKDVNVNIIYNENICYNFQNIEPGHWRYQDIDNFENAKKLVVILNDNIRNVFDFTTNREEFKRNSFRK